MKKEYSIFNFFKKEATLLMGIIFLFSSCVGVVDDVNPPTTKGATASSSVADFEGILAAYPVAHSKVEVIFNPAFGLARDLTYIVTYDGLPIPYTFPGETLDTDYRGYLKVTIGDLAINNPYNFQVQAIDDVTGQQSLSDATILVSTFGNITANFWGIANASNLAGADGRNSIFVTWPAAEKQGSDFLPYDIDPVNYEIILINADLLTPSSFDDVSQPTLKRKVVLVAGTKISHQVNGLSAGTKYLVRIQALHHGYSEYGTDPNYQRDSNTKYLEIETLGDNASGIVVDLTSFAVNTGQGIAGLSSFDVIWDVAQGALDHYRIYYKVKAGGTAWSSYKTAKDDICNGQETDPDWFCKKVAFSESFTSITDLIPFTEYDVYGVICLTLSCNATLGVDFIEYVSNPPYKTSPNIATFGGIEAIENPKYYWALDEIYLQYTPPDLDTGVADGLLVQVKERIGATVEGPIASDVYLNHPVEANGSYLFVPPFNFVTDTEITVRGILPNVADDYCFSVVPYLWKGGVVVPSLEGESVSCIKPEIKAPTKEEFQGIGPTGGNPAINEMILNWNTPSQGVYDTYVVWIRDDGGDFVFTEAKQTSPPHPDYTRFEVPFGTLSISLPFLPTGDYKFGVLTYFSGTGDYSEDVPSSIKVKTVP
jgi:hypothetical protein